MKKSLLAVALVAATASVAAADDSYGPEDNFEPIGRYGQLGIGLVARSADSAMAQAGDQYGFDGAFRLGKVWRAHDRVRPGGFFEVRTVDFDTFEVAAGPQVQFRVGEKLALQLRGGVGAEANGRTYALAGLAVGNAWIGGSVTAHRMFGEDDETQISANLELPAVAALFPVALVYILGGGEVYSTR